MEYTEDDILRKWLLSDSLNFARFFYQHQNNGKKLVIGKHHRLICDKLNLVLQGKIRRLLINIAPRYGKTEIAVKGFISNGLAINPASKFIHLSYSSNLALDNSIAIKNTVESEEFQRLFPMRVGMNRDTNSQWDTEAGGGVYATSSLGQVTGFGAGAVENEGETNPIFSGAIVIDDPIKPADALNENSREAVNRHFETTIRNRVNSRYTPIVVIMQRLHEQDLCGYLTSIEPDEWEVLSIPCLEIDDEGNEVALWEFKHTVEELHKIEAANQFVFDTQYMQNPKPLEGLMYSGFRTYEALPLEPGLRKNYTDTADSGADFLCSVCYVEYPHAMYVTDVLYTDKPMEYTEPETASMLLRNGTIISRIESNNGGRGFCRNVEKAVRIVNSPLARRMQFVPFHQGGNKVTRILTRSAEVQNMIYFPADWESRWPKFARAVKGFRKKGRNTNDDGPDVLTGMVEFFRKDSATPIKANPKKYSTERT